MSGWGAATEATSQTNLILRSKVAMALSISFLASGMKIDSIFAANGSG
jgi:hypothetical protein